MWCKKLFFKSFYPALQDITKRWFGIGIFCKSKKFKFFFNFCFCLFVSYLYSKGTHKKGRKITSNQGLYVLVEFDLVFSLLSMLVWSWTKINNPIVGDYLLTEVQLNTKFLRQEQLAFLLWTLMLVN